MRTEKSIPGSARRITFAIVAIIACFGVEAAAAVPPGGSIVFNGANSYAAISSGSYLGGATVSNFTIEFWLKAGRVDACQTLFGKTEFWKEWSIGMGTSGEVGFFHAWPNIYYPVTSPTGVIKAGQWQHVAVVGQGKVGSIYVDGVLVKQAESLRGEISFNCAASGSAVAPMTFGFRDNTTLPDDCWFLGELADIRIWDIALSVPQIAVLQTADPATNAPGLRHWIPFDVGSGSTFSDIVGGLQGQVFNTTWTMPSPRTVRVPQDYGTIQAAVNAAAAGDTILISDGTYEEHDITINKPLVLKSVGGMDKCSIDAQEQGRVFFVDVPDSGRVVLEGLTVRRGNPGRAGGGAVRRINGVLVVTDCLFEANYANGGVIDARGPDGEILREKTTVIGCIFRNNNAENYSGVLGVTAYRCLLYNNTAWNGGVVLGGSDAYNCVAYGNTGGRFANGAYGGTLVNCILWANSGPDGQQIVENSCTARYSIIQNGYPGTGNLDTDPRLVDPANGNFHLQADSPAINAGDPAGEYNDPDGTRSDIGAFPFFHPDPLTQGLVAYYPFNGNANDESGGGRNGVVLASSGVVLAADRFQEAEHAYRFDGDNSQVRSIRVATDLLNTGQQEYTISLWCATADPAKEQSIVNTDPHPGLAISIANRRTTPGALGAGYHVGSGESGWSEWRPASSFGWDRDRWYHVVFTKKATQYRLYLDGVNKDIFDLPQAATFDRNLSGLLLGSPAPASFPEATWYGSLDDIRIYNRALTESEVVALYEFESTAPGSAPLITRQPQDVLVDAGGTGTFSVEATGTEPLSYQWRRDGRDITGATDDTLTITNLAPWDMGYYSVVVTNTTGSATSEPARLTVEGFEFDVWRGLLAHYTFDGNPNDVSGNEHHGVSAGTGLTYPADRFGVANAALEAAGTGGAIQIPTLAGIGPTTSNAFSMAFWARRNTFGSVLTKFLNGSASGSDFAVWLSGGAINVTGNGLDYLATGHTPANEWTHFCVSIGPGDKGVKVWADGTLLDESAVTLNSQVSATGMLIGRLTGFPDNPLFGAIDDLRLYGRALTDSNAGKIFSIDSEPAVPLIAVQPEDQTILEGDPAELRVGIYSPSAATYQWHGPSGALPAGTNSILTWPAVVAADAGSYWAVIENKYGSVTSRVATLTVAIPPSITQSPAGATLVEGNPLVLSVMATGSEPLQYQWFKDGATLAGATGSTFSLAQAQLEDAGAYWATVTNAYGTATSSQAVVRVVERTDYRLNVIQGGGGGLVMTDPFLQNYPSNAVAQCTALPAGGWTFLDWLGDLEGTNPVATLVMNSDKCIQARFGAELVLLYPAHGSFEVIPETTLYPAGYPVQFRALPDPGYYFAQWIGSAEDWVNPGYYAVDSAWMVVGASFLPLGTNEVSLTVWPEGRGDVEFDRLDNRFPKGSTVTLTAWPEDGQVFLGWENDAGGIENPLTVVMDRSKLIRARFTSRPRLDAVVCSGPLHDGSPMLLLTGEWGGVYQIQASSDLIEWHDLTILTNALGTTQFRDPTALESAPRFYRAQEVIAVPAGMALIPAGPFEMGDTFGEGRQNELPVHTVYVSEFSMDRVEVTKAQWDEVYQWAIAHGYSFDNPGSYWNGTNYNKGENHPVHYLNWYDAVKWCNARSEREGKILAYYIDSDLTQPFRKGQADPFVRWNAGYRLPTEAEWEKAARGGLSGKRFPWGDTITHYQANYFSITADSSYDTSPTRGHHPAYATGDAFTSPVASFAANGYGLYDMVGDVWNWCWDWYGESYYASLIGTDPRGPASGSARIRRGGCWDDRAFVCRTSFRGYGGPGGGFGAMGFRTVLSPGQP